MELVYLWVEKYKNIENQGFNFSPRFTCNYENGTLTINKKEPEPINIFPSNINVTAIVGENGSGKSTILELLKNDYGIEHEQTLFFVYYDVQNKQLIFPGLNLSPLDVGVTSFPFQIKVELPKTIQRLANTKTLFYTHLFHNDYDLKLEYIGLHHTLVANLSTIYEMAEGNHLELSDKAEDKMRRSNFSKILRTYHTRQIKKAVLSIKKGMKLPFDTPKYLIIGHLSMSDILPSIKASTENQKLQTFYQKIENIYELSVASWKRGEKLDIDDIGVKLILSFLERKSQYQDEHIEDFLTVFEQFLIEEDVGNYVSLVYKELENKNFSFIVNNNEKKVNLHFSYLETFFKQAKSFYNNYHSLIREERPPISYSFGNEVTKIEKNDFSFLENYINVTYDGQEFLEFKWHNLSNGEESFLYQFARFFYIKNYPRFLHGEKIEDKENLIILLDEGEMTLHPQWQKQYVAYWIDFLKTNFNEHICHLVVTSHSPFILSDIPKKNVIFLEKGKQVYPNIETFGANIHTLLSHGFFMKEGLMGEFAKNKINEVIDYLNGKASPIKDDDEAQRYIRIIGEPILKRQLQKMLDSKHLKKIKKIKKQITELQQKLEEHQHAQD